MGHWVCDCRGGSPESSSVSVNGIVMTGIPLHFTLADYPLDMVPMLQSDAYAHALRGFVGSTACRCCTGFVYQGAGALLF